MHEVQEVLVCKVGCWPGTCKPQYNEYTADGASVCRHGIVAAVQQSPTQVQPGYTLHEPITNAGSQHTYMEDSAIEIQPDSVLLPQVVPQLANLSVHLQHGGNVLLCLCSHRCVQLLHLVRPLHRQKATLGTGWIAT